MSHSSCETKFYNVGQWLFHHMLRGTKVLWRNVRLPSTKQTSDSEQYHKNSAFTISGGVSASEDKKYSTFYSNSKHKTINCKSKSKMTKY